MKVYLVMGHERGADDEDSPKTVERVFATEDMAVKSLDSHMQSLDCVLDKVLAGATTYHALRTPLFCCTCDLESFSIDEWEVEERA
ncbi:MAG: hypothetical protein ABIT01_01815 [Thermoanaerobaculia bacterium]